MNSTWPNTAKYLGVRDSARKRTQAEFLSNHPKVLPLIAIGNEYVANCMFFLNRRNMSRLKHGLYICDLIISFTRTHFIAQDLIGQGELIEAAVLIRKQMELQARLHELVKVNEFQKLIRKTPNVRELGHQIRRLYTAYSEVAHSSDPIHLQLLGRIDVDGKQYTPFEPVYNENAIVTFQHLMVTVIEFYDWSHPFLSASYDDYDAESAQTLINDFARHFLEAFPCNPDEHV